MIIEFQRPQVRQVELAGQSVIRNCKIEHSQQSPFSVQIPYAPELEIHAETFSPFILEDDGQILRYGVCTRVESDEERHSTTIEGVGPGWFLQRNETSVRYQNIFTHEAIDDYWTNHTQFDVDVTYPEENTIATATEIQSITSESEWNDLISSVSFFGTKEWDGSGISDFPFEVGPSGPYTTPVTWLSEAEDLESSSIESDELSGGEGLLYIDLGGFWSFDFYVGHDIPEPQYAQIILRGRNDSTVRGDLTFDGQNILQDITVFGDDIGWSTYELDLRDITVSEGVHNISFDVGAGSIDSGETGLVFDLVGFRDLRANTALANTVHEPGGYLDGPGIHPNVSIQMETANAPSTVQSAEISSQWTSTDNDQRIGISFDGGVAWYYNDNTTTTSQEANTQTTTVDTEARISATGTRDTATPRKRYQSQEVSEWHVFADLDARTTIEDQAFTGNHLENLQSLHEQANMNFVLNHASEIKSAKSFPTGTNAPSEIEWNTLSTTRDMNMGDEYANVLILKGARKPESERDGPTDIRYSRRAEDDAEIQRLIDKGVPPEDAKVQKTMIDTRLESQAAVDQQVQGRLANAVDKRTMKGEVSIQPTLIPPGYEYEVDEFDGAKATLQTVSFSLQNGTLSFRETENLVPELAILSSDVQSTKESL